MAKIFSEWVVILLAPKISVVMPLFNAERYVELAVSSVLSQTFKEFELILVDDCSTDNTLSIVEGIDDARIKIIRNEKNLGTPGATRNVGLDAAAGEFVFFMDDDDVLLERGLETLFAAAKSSTDVVNTTKWYESQNLGADNAEDIKLNVVSMQPAAPVSADLKVRIYQEFLLGRMHITPWLFLYRRKFLLDNNIKFPAEAAEDVFFNFDVICATDRIVKIDEPVYIWRAYQASTTRDPARFARNLNSILNLHAHISDKLEPLNDSEFTAAVLYFWTEHTLDSYVATTMNRKSTAEIWKALEPHFGRNSSFVTALLQLYCLK